MNEVAAFYSELFTSESSSSWEENLNGIPSTTSNLMNSRLVRPMDDNEVKKAIFSMTPNKALGMDIEDAVTGKIASWKRFLSQAGKEVLLKSVVMALSNYSMSCYKLSHALCKKN